MAKLLLVSMYFLGFYLNAGSNLQPNKLEGFVRDSQTGLPIEKALVYISKGEEEALTDASGHFSIRTQSVGSITLTAEKTGFQLQAVKVNIDQQPFIFKLIKVQR
jgi:Carboxypeptidase regulatory-like domain